MIARTLPPRAFPLSTRGGTLLVLALACLAAAFAMDLDPRALLPSEGGRRMASDFLSRALSPALTYEADFVPEGTAPLLLKVLFATGRTVAFAAAAMSLALVGGGILGFLGSTAWWVGDPVAHPGAIARVLHTLRPAAYLAVRFTMTLMRSIHELLWAVLFLAAFGITPISAVTAIAIPYAGTLAKVFSEVLDEAPRDAARALQTTGASPVQVLLVGLLPRALPDMLAYALYRFECALRSSAILGFFGFPTLGYFLSASFENLYYSEVWTYLYALLVLVVATDRWSGALRRRLVGGVP